MQVEAIAQYLQVAGLGTMGSTLFAYYLPANLNTGVLLLPRKGRGLINPQLPGWRKLDGFQVIVRDSDLLAAQSLAARINAALVTETNFTLPGYSGAPDLLVYNIRAVTDPFVYERDEAAVWEVSVNYDTCYVIGA